MKKNLLFFAIIVTSLTLVSFGKKKQSKNVNTKQTAQKALFSRSTMKCYDVAFPYGEMTSLLRQLKVVECDEKGDTLNITEYDVQGDSISKAYKYVFTYDEKGNRLNEKFYDFSCFGGEADITTVYTYDEYGKLVQETVKYDNSRNARKKIYTYDETGNRFSRLVYEYIDGCYDCEHSDSILTHYSYVYLNEKGDTINNTYSEVPSISGAREQQNTYNAKGKLIATQVDYYLCRLNRDTYSYDENGNMIKHIFLCYDGTVCERDIYIYDEEGYLIRSEHFDNTETMIRFVEYEYE